MCTWQESKGREAPRRHLIILINNQIIYYVKIYIKAGSPAKYT